MASSHSTGNMDTVKVAMSLTNVYAGRPNQRAVGFCSSHHRHSDDAPKRRFHDRGRQALRPWQRAPRPFPAETGASRQPLPKPRRPLISNTAVGHVHTAAAHWRRRTPPSTTRQPVSFGRRSPKFPPQGRPDIHRYRRGTIPQHPAASGHLLISRAPQAISSAPLSATSARAATNSSGAFPGVAYGGP